VGPKEVEAGGVGAPASASSMHDLDGSSTNTGSDTGGGFAMTANERAEEIDRAIHSLERELASRPHAKAGRDVLGKVLAALWALRTEAADQPGQMLH
jgi:hypothetical protein